MTFLPKHTHHLKKWISHIFTFKVASTLIVILGLSLRLLNYTNIPAFNTTADEFMYPWAGMSLIQTGTPTSWSAIKTYKEAEYVRYWDQGYNLITPWIHKPLLYPILTGSIMLMTGVTEFYDVRLSLLRLIPIALSGVTIALILLVTKRLFDQHTALLAGLLYACVPTIVFTNRLSLIESLLVPLMLLSILAIQSLPKKFHSHTPYIIGSLAIAAILTKQVGIAIGAAAFATYLVRGKYKSAAIVASMSLAGLVIYIGTILYYTDLEALHATYTNVSNLHIKGLPKLLIQIFRNPVIAGNNTPFPDPFILGGYLFLFASMWRQQKKSSLETSHTMLALVPLFYLLVLMVTESGSSRFFGWHIYPLFPFAMIALAQAWRSLFHSGNLTQIVGMLVIMSPALSWLLVVFPPLMPYWQAIIVMAAAGTAILGTASLTTRQTVITTSFVGLMCLSIAVVYNGSEFLPSKEQPEYTPPTIINPKR